MNFDFFRIFFQNCWNCERSTWSALTVCDFCRKVFERQITELPAHTLKIENIPLHFLAYYQYGIEEKLIFSLKGAACSNVNFDYVAGILLERMCLDQLKMNQLVFVTPDSKHSIEIVNSINKSLVSCVPIIVVKNGLEPNKLAQKFKKKRERKTIAFNFIGNSVDKSKSFIFIDDVVATGSTAIAAWYALGRPVSFEIWSLAYRPKLAASAFY